MYLRVFGSMYNIPSRKRVYQSYSVSYNLYMSSIVKIHAHEARKRKPTLMQSKYSSCPAISKSFAVTATSSFPLPPPSDLFNAV